MAEQIKIYKTSDIGNDNASPILTIDKNEIKRDYQLSLVGLEKESYIIEMNNNFVKLLENFASDSEPNQTTNSETGEVENKAIEGQLWYDSTNETINFRATDGWTSDADKLGGKTLDSVREYVLSGLDTSGKLPKVGGEVLGEINVNGAVAVDASIEPISNEESSLGTKTSRFRNIYLKEDGIVLGDETKGLRFKPQNFVYVVDNDNVDVSNFPAGAILLHQETGEAIIKKSTGKFGSNNNTFRKLADDKQNSAAVGGNHFIFMGDKGLIAGGYSNQGGGHSNASIEQFRLSTPSNGTYFSNLSYGRSHMGSGMSSVTRGVFQGGWNGRHGSHNGKMDYVTFASPKNATYFGTFGHENYGSSSVSDGTRGVIGPGYNHRGGGPRGHHYVSKYITIETPGNANKFGTISSAYWGSAISSGTRGVFGGYSRRGWSSRLEYITIQTPRNSVYFSNTTRHRGPSPSTVTDTIRGVYFSGWVGHWNNRSMEYITISTPSNSIAFGTTYKTTGTGVGVSNGVTGVSAGGYRSNGIAEYITIATPMNGKYFGNLAKNRWQRPSSASGN